MNIEQLNEKPLDLAKSLSRDQAIINFLEDKPLYISSASKTNLGHIETEEIKAEIPNALETGIIGHGNVNSFNNVFLAGDTCKNQVSCWT